MRQLAADLRRFTEAVRGYDCRRIKRFANGLDLEAAEMEAGEGKLGFPVRPVVLGLNLGARRSRTAPGAVLETSAEPGGDGQAAPLL